MSLALPFQSVIKEQRRTKIKNFRKKSQRVTLVDVLVLVSHNLSFFFM